MSFLNWFINSIIFVFGGLIFKGNWMNFKVCFGFRVKDMVYGSMVLLNC